MSAVPLITLQSATKGFSDKPLFSDLSLVITDRERVALIGDNGCGKSTLLKVLAGIEELDAGIVSSRKGIVVAYVAQQDVFEANSSVGDIMDSHLTHYGFDHDEIARRSSMYLGMAGFEDSGAIAASLSGGWRKRLSISLALALEPDCLLLDEPTNHLDIDSIEWLEQRLGEIESVVVFVSHDRYFIERLANRVIEINTAYPRGHIASNGGYADYMECREALLTELQQQRKSLSNKVRREVEWLRQGVKARTTKSRARINEAHALIDQLKGTQATERQEIEFGFSSTARKTKELLKVEKVAQSFGEKKLFAGVNLVLSPGSRLAIVGPNGSGKTTLVRTLLGELPPQSGTVKRAPGLRIYFMDQARTQLKEGVTLREFLCPHGDSLVVQGQSVHVAAWGARFMFSHDHLARQLGALSGGERARALLARSIAEESDVLVFDEPTNDLDIATLENLESGFESFPGAIVLITHDRYLLDRAASTVLGLHDGQASFFGNYSQWEEFKRERMVRARKQASAVVGDSRQVAPQPKQNKKLSYKDARELSMMECEIEKAEVKLEGIKHQLDSGAHATDAEKLTELCADLAKQQLEVDRLYQRWQELEALS